ncbi:sulfur oxidation c-type cytochrome SoxX [Roseomonas sp. CCTCC AB2023176]|uniref:sulfur oxidation c-type cytochrome SoxX n=1 Tax=Roseomonas sp. CCTCC AB2023176 TaxID=3342640 RepID=UPI0035E32D74
MPVRGVGLAVLALLAAAPAAGRVAPFVVEEDAIAAPLDGLSGGAARGEAVVRNRETANCLICHSIPGTAERFMGDVGPPLVGVGARLSPGQIRLRVVDPTRVNPEAIMPPYHRTERLLRVDPRYRGQPVLTAQEVEDVVAYLSALKE